MIIKTLLAREGIGLSENVENKYREHRISNIIVQIQNVIIYREY